MRKYIGVGLIAVSAVFFLVSAIRHNTIIGAAAMEELNTVVIVDAGHGGEDGGASSASGVQESMLNLQIALRLEQMLALSGLEPYMIRSDDRSVYSDGCETISDKKVSDLKNRVQTVNSISNGLLVSIHQNHFSQPKYSGAQVFYSNTDGSRELAELLQTQLRESLDRSNDRQCKKAESVYLMNNIACTGVLVECGFLSNSEEAYLLQNPDYQKKIVCALGCALNVYLEGTMMNEV